MGKIGGIITSVSRRFGRIGNKNSKTLSRMTKLGNIPLVGPILTGAIPGFSTVKNFLGVNQWANKGLGTLSKGLLNLIRVSKKGGVLTALKGTAQTILGGGKWLIGKGLITAGVLALPTILGGGYLLSKLVGGIGNIFKPKGPSQGTLEKMPSFDPMPLPQQPTIYQSASGNNNSAQRAALNQQKIDLMEKIAETKSEMISNQRRKSLFKPYQDSFNENVTKLYAKGKPTDEKIDTIIELLNTMNAIVNENRRISLHNVRLKENEVDYELMKSTELYRGLSRLQGQLNSANNEAAMARLEASAGMANMATQTKGVASAVKQQTAQAKAVSAAKWGLGGAALALLASHSGLLGSLVSGLGGVMSTIAAGASHLVESLGSGFHMLGSGLVGVMEGHRGIVSSIVNNGESTDVTTTPTTPESWEKVGERVKNRSIGEEISDKGTEHFSNALDKLSEHNYLGAVTDAAIGSAEWSVGSVTDVNSPIFATFCRFLNYSNVVAGMNEVEVAKKMGVSVKEVKEIGEFGKRIHQIPELSNLMRVASSGDKTRIISEFNKLKKTEEGAAALTKLFKLTKLNSNLITKVASPGAIDKLRAASKSLKVARNLGVVEGAAKTASWWEKGINFVKDVTKPVTDAFSGAVDWVKSKGKQAIGKAFELFKKGLTAYAPGLAKRVIPLLDRGIAALTTISSKMAGKLASRGLSVMAITVDLIQAFSRFRSGDGMGALLSILLAVTDIFSIPFPHIGFPLSALILGWDAIREHMNDSEYEALYNEIDERLADEKAVEKNKRDWESIIAGNNTNNADILLKSYLSRKDINVATKIRTKNGREFSDLIKNYKEQGISEEDVVNNIRSGKIKVSDGVQDIVNQRFDNIADTGLTSLNNPDGNANTGEADDGMMLESAKNVIRSFFGDGISMDSSTEGGGQSLQNDVPYNEELGQAIANEYKGLEGKLEYNQNYRDNTYNSKRRAADCSSSTRDVYKKITDNAINPGERTADIVNRIESGTSGFEWVTRGDIPMKVSGYNWADGKHNSKPLNSKPLDVSQAKPGDLLLESRDNKAGSKYSVGHVNIVTKAPTDANGTDGEYYSHGGIPKFGPTSRKLSDIKFRKDLIGIARFNWDKASPALKSKFKMPTATKQDDQNANKLEGGEITNSPSSNKLTNSNTGGSSVVSNSGNTYITNNYNTTNNSSIQNSRAL